MRRIPSALFSLSMLVCSAHARAEDSWDRNGFDRDDLEALALRHPGARASLVAGEAHLRAGDVQAAADSFAKVAAEAPELALPHRRLCQALTELGKRGAALVECQTALEIKASAPGFRASVRALTSAPARPEELVLATQLATAAKRRMSDQPWSLAAIGDIAERTGDEQMLNATVVELERIAPGHYETLRARKALDGFRLPRWAWGAWLALGAAVVAALAHAARAALVSSGARRKAALLAPTALILLSVLLRATPSLAQEAPAAPPPGGLSKWPVNDSDPNRSLPTAEQRDKNPLEFGYHMMDLADKADIARRKGDFAAVGRYYEAMAVAVPDRAIGYRKACEGYEKAGNLEKAIAMCRGALGGDGLAVDDYQHFAKLVLAKPGELSAADIEDLSQIAVHLKAEQGAMAAGVNLQCELAQRLDDVQRLEDCVTVATRETPNDPRLLVFQWGLAMKKEDYRQAEALIAAARQKSLKPAGIEMMERATREQSAIGRRVTRTLQRNALPIAIGGGVLGALALGLAFRRRLKQPSLA